MEEAIGKQVNIERSQELVATGADRIATACPFCYIMIDDGIKAEGADDDVVVGDISMHLLEALENRDAAAARARQSELLAIRTPAPEPVAVAVAEPRAAVPAPARKPVSAPTPAPDDFTRIKGTDPALARALPEYGVVTYEDLAGLDDAGVQALEAALEIPGRISKWKWPAQAAALIAERDETD